MTTQDNKPDMAAATDTPTLVFEAFLVELAKNGIEEDTINRLRNTLITEKKFSDKVLKDAIFSPEQTS